MKSRVTFYLFITALTVLDAVLLRSPNLLGKIGLVIYKYHYLRTFPKALLTVAIVVGIAVLLVEGIRMLVRLEKMKRFIGGMILFLLLAASVAILVKTALDFRAWSYSHTGLRFRIGAFLLPSILIVVNLYALASLPKVQKPFPESPSGGERNKENIHVDH
jgi:hypothetical protein